MKHERFLSDDDRQKLADDLEICLPGYVVDAIERRILTKQAETAQPVAHDKNCASLLDRSWAGPCDCKAATAPSTLLEAAEKLVAALAAWHQGCEDQYFAGTENGLGDEVGRETDLAVEKLRAAIAAHKKGQV